MRVLMLSHMYPSPVNPTAGIFVHEQVRALRSLGHDVRVVSPKGWAPPLLSRWGAYRDVPSVDTVEGVPVLYPRKLTLPRNLLGPYNCDAMLWAIRKPLLRVHRRWPFDVIHAHMLVPDGWAAAAVGAELEVPVVATGHRADVLDVPARGARHAAQVERAVETIDQVVTVSRAIGDAAEALGRPRRAIRVVPNGADTQVFYPRERRAARERLGLPPDEPTISYVGKLVPRKGVDTMVEAMGVLAARRDPVPLLVVAGIGELRGAMEARASELGVGDRIRFLGKVPHEEVPWVMATGDVFVLPSLSEGLPTVVCEAMACGLPVVATAVDGTPEAVRDGETGYLVPPREPKALADALGRVLDDADGAERMRERALEIALQIYTWDANAHSYDAIYAELTG
jgi:glycosyltransferase involved in cell wall biosynthesis